MLHGYIANFLNNITILTIIAILAIRGFAAMENHPIPQDITGFQFKLIGKMTVKQFVYLAVGAIIGWVFFFILPLPAIIKWPVAIISVFIGGAFAFVPIDGRPLDTMVKNFISALFAPTRFIYEKGGGQPQAQSGSASVPPPTPIPAPPAVIHLPPPQTSQPANPIPPQPQQYIPPMPEKPQDQVKIIQESIPHPPPTKEDQASAEQNKSLEIQLNESLRQKELLEKEILTLRAKTEASGQTFNPTVATPPVSTQRVRKVPPGMEGSVGLTSAPVDPNLITGIVKDPRGNPLPNILVEVKDTEANPVRAFKTNGLGKFASATSLSNGKYIITFEDTKEQHKFDAVEIEAEGNPIMPLEIISVDPREELRRELFN